MLETDPGKICFIIVKAREVQARDSHDERETAYLLGTPLLPDYLEEGLAMHDISCTDFEAERL